jgi:hypothetical protein
MGGDGTHNNQVPQGLLIQVMELKKDWKSCHLNEICSVVIVVCNCRTPVLFLSLTAVLGIKMEGVSTTGSCVKGTRSPELLLQLFCKSKLISN